MDNKFKSAGRRKFLGDAAALGMIGAIGAGQLLGSCTSRSKKTTIPVSPGIAPDGPPLRAGIIGCGSRGTGAAFNFIDAGPNLQITALGDVFQDRIDRCRSALKEQRGVEIPDKNCFVGFDAYKRVIDSDVDVIIETSLAYCRPAHFEAAIQARKHVFLEKPAGVDPVGTRSVMAMGKMAESAGLSVVCGTQRRHSLDFIATNAMVQDGAIGELISGNCYSNGMASPFVTRQPGWSDMEYMIRNRGNWIWLTGDTVVNMLVHTIDVLNWFFGKYPVKATGFGGRHRRHVGDMYDFFSVDFSFDNEKRFQGMCRQIDGCDNSNGVLIFGTEGYTNCRNSIWDYNGKLIWEYEYPPDEQGRPGRNLKIPPFNQSHINLVTAIRTGKPVNETQAMASSTMVALMGRESAYTGKDISWEDMMNSGLNLVPDKLELGPVDKRPVSPVPGTAPKV